MRSRDGEGKDWKIKLVCESNFELSDWRPYFSEDLWPERTRLFQPLVQSQVVEVHFLLAAGRHLVTACGGVEWMWKL